MLFSELTEYFIKIEATNLRNEKTVILAELLTKLDERETGRVAYLISGRVAPQYEPIEIGMAGKQVVKAVALATHQSEENIEAEYKKSGELGILVEKYNQDKKVIERSIADVFEELRVIAEDSGSGSVERKIRRLAELLTQVTPKSANLIVRLILGKLRLGFSNLTLIDALSWSVCGSKGDREVLEAAFSAWNDLGEVARVYKSGGREKIAQASVTPGRPVSPMRAERLGTIGEITTKLGSYAVEPKLDGMRVQVHVWGAQNTNNQAPINKQLLKQENLFEDPEEKIKVKIFSRGLEDITHQFPEVVTEARKVWSEKGDFVVDGEAIGVNPTTGEFLPFQETIKRKRKHDVGVIASQVPIKVYLFDILYANGREVISQSYDKRREILKNIINSGPLEVFEITESTIVSSEERAREIFKKYVKKKLEGMLCKKLDSTYRAGARDFAWVKYKKAHEADLADSLDCVVMGYYKGKGKRSDFGLGAFLVGVLANNQDPINNNQTTDTDNNPDNIKILTIAKIGTGLTDEQFKEMYQRLKMLEERGEMRDSRYVVDKTLVPDVWVEPKIIVEVEADEITISPTHSSGYALRFPRLLRIRDDKKIVDITTLAEVKQMQL